MGGKSAPGPSPEVQSGMLANQSALVKIAQEQAGHGTKLFETAFPGFETAEQFTQALATGDPAAISKLEAPTAQSLSATGAAAKKSIMENAPAGGEKNLALESVDVSKGSVLGSLTGKLTTEAPNILAALSGQGVGESISAAGTGISGYSAGSQTLSSLGGMQIEGQKIQAEEKGNVLGSLSSLASSGMEAGAFLAA